MKKMFVPIIIILALASFGTVFSVGFDAKKIDCERKEKDQQFKKAKDSPIPDEEKTGFKGLEYFAPSKEFIFNAKFTKYPKPDTVKMLTSKKEKTKLMLKWGKLTFTYKDKQYKLNGYMMLPITKDRELFVPFTDVTTGYNSYEAGRYLDIPMKAGKKSYILDFNSAYNPYCAYNKKYSCPLVPMDNHLTFEVLAGEKFEKKSMKKKK